MKTTSLILALAASGLLSSASLHAQPTYPGPGDRAPSMGAGMPPMQRMAPRKPSMYQFPSPQELARMAPPEPMTEKRIQERFAKQRAQMTEALDRDREAATRYAQDFSRYQKQQSDALAELMARAETRREAMLKRLDEREQQVLERFRQHQQAQDDAAKPAAPQSPAQ